MIVRRLIPAVEIIFLVTFTAIVQFVNGLDKILHVEGTSHDNLDQLFVTIFFDWENVIEKETTFAPFTDEIAVSIFLIFYPENPGKYVLLSKQMI